MINIPELSETDQAYRYFNSLPRMCPDPKYVAAMTVWPIEEAPLYCFNLDPYMVFWVELQIYRHVSPYVKTLFMVRDLLNNAVLGGAITDPVKPLTCIKFVQEKGLPIATEIASLFLKPDTSLQGLEAQIKNLEKTIASLRHKNAELEMASKTKGLDRRKRESRALITAGTARLLHFDSDRSKVAKNICDEIASMGHERTERNVKDALKEIFEEIESIPKNIHD